MGLRKAIRLTAFGIGRVKGLLGKGGGRFVTSEISKGAKGVGTVATRIGTQTKTKLSAIKKGTKGKTIGRVSKRQLKRMDKLIKISKKRKR